MEDLFITNILTILTMTTFLTTVSLALVTLTIIHQGVAININKKCKCGIVNSNVGCRIIGGTEVPAGKYPWLVHVTSTAPNNQGACTGAIISDRHVLLASHCVDNVTSGRQVKVSHSLEVNNMFAFMLGQARTFRVNEDGVFKKERGMVAASIKNDIAILELEDKLTFSEEFNPICLSPSLNVDNLFAAGWGAQVIPKRKNGEIDYSSIPGGDRKLSEMPMIRVPDRECMSKRIYTQIDFQICTSGVKGYMGLTGPTSNICRGDSGGPLMTKGKDGRISTIGVASTSDCNTTHKIATYEKITSHFDWIDDITKDAEWCQGSEAFFD